MKAETMRYSVALQLFVIFLYFELTATIPASSRGSFKIHKDPRIPNTSFTCGGKPPGYYADVDTGCQVYHMCDDGARQYTYTCPNTTLFHQRMLICAHWYQVNCTYSEHDVDANLLIGQKDKPFVGEDFWKHRFGGAGNINFPLSEFPVKSIQSNAIYKDQQNTDKGSIQDFNVPAKTPFKLNSFQSSPPPQPQQQQQQQQTIVQNNNVPVPSALFQAPDQYSDSRYDQAQQNIAQFNQALETPFIQPTQFQSQTQYKPSIELEPPVQDDTQRAVEQNELSTNKRDNRFNDRDSLSSDSTHDSLHTVVPKQNVSDDRFTQVYILPTGKQPAKGPYQHPDLVQTKVILTDWNSLLEQKRNEVLLSNINEYIGDTASGDESHHDDLDRDFTSHVPRPFGFNVASTTDRIEGSPTVRTEVRIPSEQTFSQNNVPFNDPIRPSIELLPPLGFNDQTQNNFPIYTTFSHKQDVPPSAYENSLNSAQFNPLSTESDDNSTQIIQNPFQHPFYTVRKMNENRIFLPVPGSEYAIELVRVPLNSTRRFLRRTSDKRSRQSKSQNKSKEQKETDETDNIKCQHCHQGYIIDRNNCVPCVPV